jgi:hypothetical protein
MKEHCILYGCDKTFQTSNYNVTTTPKFEWTLIVDGQQKAKSLKHKQPDPYEIIEVNTEHARTFPPIAELLEDPRSKAANLKRPEVIAVVMYTGPMVLCLFLSRSFH